MKKLFYTAFLCCTIMHPEPLTWQKLRNNYKHDEQHLKKSIKEEILSSFAIAGCQQTRTGEARMLAEIILNHMNNDQSKYITKQSLHQLLCAFCTNSAQTLAFAEKIVEEMSLNNNDLKDAQEILNKVGILYDINYALPVFTCPLIPACNNISTDENHEELEQKIKNGIISESQIVECMYMQTLIKSLALCLIIEHNNPYQEASGNQYKTAQ